jgi:hypothetical protein
MREFWNSEITDASFRKLQELNGEFDFVLIGGWAVYLYTKLQKSRDIDIVVDYPALRKIEGSYRLEKNGRLSKYEIKLDSFDVDIYLPGYSKLALPAKSLLGDYVTKVERFRVPSAEALMLLKIGAAEQRLASVKGDKDAIDMVGLLFYSGIDIQRMVRIAKDNSVEGSVRFIFKVLEGFRQENLDYLNLNAAGFSKLKRKHAEILKRNL